MFVDYLSQRRKVRVVRYHLRCLFAGGGILMTYLSCGTSLLKTSKTSSNIATTIIPQSNLPPVFLTVPSTFSMLQSRYRKARSLRTSTQNPPISIYTCSPAAAIHAIALVVSLSRKPFASAVSVLTMPPLRHAQVNFPSTSLSGVIKNP